jgi:hypothetical protein
MQCMPLGGRRLREYLLGRLDKLLLWPADLAVDVYPRISVEVFGADQPEHPVVVGAPATLPIYRGTPPEMVQYLLDHTSIQLTLNGYSHWMPLMGRAAAENRDEAFW